MRSDNVKFVLGVKVVPRTLTKADPPPHTCIVVKPRRACTLKEGREIYLFYGLN